MPFSVGPMELVIVLVIALLILGPKRSPRPARPSARACAGSRSRSAAPPADEDDEPSAIPVAARAD